MIILDLNSEVSPVWTYTHSYFGKPFIWCLLHNYGGTRGIYGNLTTIATGPIDAMNTPGSTMIGVGVTPEAIEHNPVVYDLMVSLYVLFICQINSHLNTVPKVGLFQAPTFQLLSYLLNSCFSVN